TPEQYVQRLQRRRRERIAGEIRILKRDAVHLYHALDNRAALAWKRGRDDGGAAPARLEHGQSLDHYVATQRGIDFLDQHLAVRINKIAHDAAHALGSSLLGEVSAIRVDRHDLGCGESRTGATTNAGHRPSGHAASSQRSRYIHRPGEVVGDDDEPR